MPTTSEDLQARIDKKYIELSEADDVVSRAIALHEFNDLLDEKLEADEQARLR